MSPIREKVDPARQRKIEPDDASDNAAFDGEAYSKITFAAKLEEIRLINSTYSIQEEIFDALESGKRLFHGYSGRCAELQFSKDTGCAIGRFQWSAEIKSGRKKILKLAAEYSILYSNLQGMDEIHVGFFVAKVGRFATYPYFRALFSHHVSESGLTLPPLPTLNERVN